MSLLLELHLICNNELKLKIKENEKHLQPNIDNTIFLSILNLLDQCYNIPFSTDQNLCLLFFFHFGPHI